MSLSRVCVILFVLCYLVIAMKEIGWLWRDLTFMRGNMEYSERVRGRESNYYNENADEMHASAAHARKRRIEKKR